MSASEGCEGQGMVLGYWAIRGLAQPIRLLLEYTGEKYKDERYECGDAPSFDRSCWMDKKYSFGLDFPNLPYLLDGEVKLTQSNAIMRYIARKHNMTGDGVLEAVADMFADQLMDLRNVFVSVAYTSADRYESAHRVAETERLPGMLQPLATFMGKYEGPWVLGDKLSYCDFLLYELLDQLRLMFPTLFESHVDVFSKFLADVEALPAIAAYMKREDFIVRPINNKMASFF